MKSNNISYKDSAARVVLEDGVFYRYIFTEYQAEYDHLMQSGLYKALLNKEYIIAHEEVLLEKDAQEKIQEQTNQNASQIYKKILPTQITFQSYPFEWSYGQWRKVVYAYLQINKIALAHGMILKDATPFNFYFEAAKPVLLDTSSFMFFEKGAPWIAYKQFCSEMLSPLALMHYNGQRWAKICMSQLRGMPLNFVSKQLPLKSWLNSTVLLHIHLHGKYANAEGDTKEAKEDLKKKNTTENISAKGIGTKQKGFTKEKLLSLTKMIQQTVVQWKQSYAFEKHWLSYYQNDISSDKYLKNKETIIREWLEAIQTTTVLDLGANTGRFSLIAREYAQQVIAIESDAICVDEIDKALKKQCFALQMDLAESTPNMGVLEEEYSSIYTRAQSSLVMALALTHHLHINNQLSFEQIATMLDRFSKQYCITEFVPATDDKVQILMKDKQKGYAGYTESAFSQALKTKFTIKDKRIIEGSERVIYLLEK